MSDQLGASVPRKTRSFKNINFGDILRRCRESWRTVVACAIGFSLIATVLAATTPHEYVANAIITAPAGAASGGFAISALKAFSRSQSSMTSVSDPQERFEVFQQLLTSEELARRMLKHDFKYTIYAGGWDARTGTWHYHTGLIGTAKRTVLSMMGFDIPAEPTASAMSGFISKGLKINTDLTSGVTTMEFEYTNADFAKKFLDTLLTETDNIVRASDVKMLSAVVGNLDQQLPQVTMREQNEALISQVTMMQIQLSQALASPQYSFTMVQAPAIEDQVAWPRPFLMIAVGFALGILFGAFLANSGLPARISAWVDNRLHGVPARSLTS